MTTKLPLVLLLFSAPVLARESVSSGFMVQEPDPQPVTEDGNRTSAGGGEVLESKPVGAPITESEEHELRLILVAGMVTSLLVSLLNKLGLKQAIGPKAVPLVTLAVSSLGAVGAGMSMGLDPSNLLVEGFLMGMVAIGSWESCIKHLVVKNK